MFERLVDDLKDSTGIALRMTSLAAAAGVSLFICTSFLCAAAVVFVQSKYGPVWACLTGAAIYAVTTALAAGIYIYRKYQIKQRPVGKTKTFVQNALADPVILATGLQIVKTIGIKRMLPILAVGGLAFGLMAKRSDSEDEED